MSPEIKDDPTAVQALEAEPEATNCPHHDGAEVDGAEVDLALEAERAVSIGRSGAGGEIGVLLVSHGSRSPTWRRMLLDVHSDVAPELLAIPGVGSVRTGFMEYTEPSIATQLRAFDEDGVRSVIVIPLLLTISDHSFDDIPTICGLAAEPERIAQLEKDKIEVYSAEAELSIAPLLDFSDLVRTNLARRVRAIIGRSVAQQGGGGRTGLVLVGYGSAEFDDEWNRFFSEIRSFAEAELAIDATAHSWCGHLVRYRRQPTIDAIEALLADTDRVVVVPVLVAYDPMFQERIIGRAVERCAEPQRVLYRRDSILPEPEVSRWVIGIAQRMVAAGTAAAGAGRG